MNPKTILLYGVGFTGLISVLAIATLLSGGSPTDREAHAQVPRPESPSSPDSVPLAQDSKLPAEFARRGLALLRNKGDVASNTQDDTLKADALIMRAWNLQQTFPESCLSVWQLTKPFVEQQQQPSQRLALASLYLSSIDAAVESAITPEAFEASWAVRQAVRLEIASHRQEVITIIEGNLKTALEHLSQPEGIHKFIDHGDRWTDMATELRGTLEPLENPPPAIVDLLRNLSDKLDESFDVQLQRLRGRLKEEAAAPDSRDNRAAAATESGPKPSAAGAVGTITRLIEDLDNLVRMRESSPVTSWTDLATRVTSQEEIESGSDPDKQLRTMEALRAQMLETRALRYNLWAADAIYNATRRGADGLSLLGNIETKLLVGAVATSYSIAEGRILNEIQDPFNRQVRIRSMLSQSKKHLTEF
jgi:hypothetical protein